MTDDLQRIRRFIGTLVRRERVVLLGRVLLQAGILVAVVAAFAVAAAAARWDRSVATAGLVLLAGVGVWAAVVLPLLGRWRRSGDALRQARLVEAAAPELRGRLVTAVERVEGPAAGESGALLGLVARRAAGVVSDVNPSRVHSALPLLRLAVAAAVCQSLALCSAVITPGGPAGTLRWWLRGSTALAAVDGLTVEDEARARVGDISISYVYPEYTGLEPLEIPNSTGDVRAPPGTVVRITARSAEVIEAAALVAYDEPALDAQVADGRVVSGSFTVQLDPGAYELLTYREGVPFRSRAFSITPEPDLPPEVMLEAASDVLEVAADERLSMSWVAKDDFGVSRVVVAIDGKERGNPLKRPTRRIAEVFGDVGFRPLDLGLAAGDEVDLTLVAWDNDTFSGSKPGSSQVVKLVVLGGRGMDRRADERQEEVIGLLVDVLASHLEERWPAGRTSHELASWGESLAKRYAPLEEFYEANERGITGSPLERKALDRIRRTGRELIRYTQVAYTPGDRSAAAQAALVVTADLRDDAVEALEDGILAIDRAIRLRALRQVVEDAQRLADTASKIEAMLAQPEVDPQELLSRLAQLEQMLAELAENSARLEEGGLKEFLNQRQSEMKDLLEEVRKAIAEGRTDEARELMARLARQMQEMRDGLQENLERMRQEADDTMEQAQDLQKELTELEEAQRDLQQRTRELREKSDEKAAEKVDELWRKLEETTRRAAERGDDYAEGLEQADRAFHEQQRALEAAEQAQRLEQSVQARDLRGAERALEQAEQAWRNTERTFHIEERRPRSGAMKGPGAREIDRVQDDLAKAEELLRQLQEAAEQADPELEGQARELEGQQQALEDRLGEARKKAQELARKFPVRPDGLEEALDDAGEQMQQAGSDLENGQPMPAEGAQGVAAQRIGDARDALKQAMEQAAQQQQGMEPGGGEPKEGERGGEPSGGSDGSEKSGAQDVQIPSPEEFRTPEEYRRALLEGMEGEVPEEFRQLKRRYYEELVHQ